MQYKQINKDFSQRKKRKEVELRLFLQKFLKKISFLPSLNKKKIEMLLTPKKIVPCKSRLKNICLSTGLDRSVISIFKTSRHVFRKNAAQKSYPGLRKASW